MPIDLKEYQAIEEKQLKSNKTLLDWMKPEEAYTTTEVQEFLGIHHPAALQRLKRLQQIGYVEYKIIGKAKYWRKLKEWQEEVEEITESIGTF